MLFKKMSTYEILVNSVIGKSTCEILVDSVMEKNSAQENIVNNVIEKNEYIGKFGHVLG